MPVGISLPEVIGDPAGMRALASALRSDAAAIAVLSSGLERQVASAAFYGPAADRMGQRLDGMQRRCVRYAERLLELARLLEVSAAQVEADLRERARKLAELRRELTPGAAG